MAVKTGKQYLINPSPPKKITQTNPNVIVKSMLLYSFFRRFDEGISQGKTDSDSDTKSTFTAPPHGELAVSAVSYRGGQAA